MIPLVLMLYISNSVLIATHEMETGDWKKNNYFGLPQNLQGFLIMHFPIFLVLSLGIVELYRNTPFGFTMSSFLSAGGLIFFLAHFYKNSFKILSTNRVLLIIAASSLIQLILTLSLNF